MIILKYSIVIQIYLDQNIDIFNLIYQKKKKLNFLFYINNKNSNFVNLILNILKQN